MTRRSFVPSLAAAGVAASRSASAAASKGRIKQAVCRGVFGKMPFEDMCKHAARLGFKGVDLVGPKEFPTLKQYGLIPTMVPGGSGIRDGINRKEFHADIEKRLHQAIDDAAKGRRGSDGIPKPWHPAGYRADAREAADEPRTPRHTARIVAVLKKLRLEPGHVVVADVAAVLAQVRGDAVGAGGDRKLRRAYRIGMASAARIADGGDVVDVDAEAQLPSH